MKPTTLEYVIYKGTKIYPGHPVHIEASPERRDGFDTIVRKFNGDPETQRVLDVEVIDPATGHVRNFRITRVVPYLRNVDKIRERIIARRRTIYNEALARMATDSKKPRAGATKR